MAANLLPVVIIWLVVWGGALFYQLLRPGGPTTIFAFEDTGMEICQLRCGVEEA